MADHTAQHKRSTLATERNRQDLSKTGTRIRQPLAEALRMMLKTRRFHEISVEDLLSEANVKKTTFYTHYSSKESILVDVVGEVVDSLRLEVPLSFATADDYTEKLKSVVESLLARYLEHGPVLRTASEEWSSIPGVRSIWLGCIDGLISHFAREIDKLRDQGRAPETIESTVLASVFVWTGERAAYMHLTQQINPLKDLTKVAETLTEVVLGAIHLDALPPRPLTAESDLDLDAEKPGSNRSDEEPLTS